jgi:hypothetical protein
MFSKPLITHNASISEEKERELQRKQQEKKQTSSVIPPIQLSYIDYFKGHILLSKYKIPELKQIAKHNKLKVSGTKPILIERIENLFKKSKKIQQIQSVFRGHITRKSFSLRGEGYKNRKLCVNENDFYTLEPLCEIPMEYFVSFKSNDGKFSFGCNIISLMHLIKTRKAIKNPYKREVISNNIIQNVIILYGLIGIIFFLPVDAPKIENINYLIKLYSRDVLDTALGRRVESNYLNRQHQSSSIIQNTGLIHERNQQINAIRLKPILLRIQGLFMEIDLLGNYTNMNWFINLERRDYIRMYRILYEIWNYRGGLSSDTKHKICIIADPFHEISRRNIDFYQVSLDVIKDICLKIMEYLVFCGIDDEYRKIGTLHVLSALTIVSMPARMAMPWLYESIHY